MRSAGRALAACIPGVLLLVFTTSGRIGVTYDSVYYLAAARSLAESGRLSTPIAPAPQQQFTAAGDVIEEHPFVIWPPGYPAVIAAVIAAGASVHLAPLVLSVCALAVLVACIATLGARAMDAETAAWCAACLGVLPAVQSVFRMAWSEPLFIALAALSIVSLAATIEDEGLRWRGWLFAGVFAALATSVRYLGVALFALHVVVAAWLAWRRRPLFRPVPAIAGLVAGAAVLAIVLGWRALLLGCWACDTRTIATSSVATNLRDFALAAVSVVPVVRAYPGTFDSIASAAVLAVVAGIAVAVRRHSVERTGRGSVLILIAFAALYCAMLLALKSITYFDPLDARLLSPAVVAASAAAQLLLFRMPARAARRCASALLVYLAGVTALDAASPTMRWRSINDETVARLPVMRALPDVSPGNILILSNDVPAIAWHTGRRLYWLPPPSMLTAVRRRYEMFVLLRTDAPCDPPTLEALRAHARELEARDGFVLLRVVQ